MSGITYHLLTESEPFSEFTGRAISGAFWSNGDVRSNCPRRYGGQPRALSCGRNLGRMVIERFWTALLGLRRGDKYGKLREHSPLSAALGPGESALPNRAQCSGYSNDDTVERARIRGPSWQRTGCGGEWRNREKCRGSRCST